MVKHLPAMWGTWVQPLGWEDPLKKEMATQYSCLENPMDGGAWQAPKSMGSQRVRHDCATSLHFTSWLMGFPGGAVVKNPSDNAGDGRDMSSIPESGRSSGEENGNPFKYSCLENSMN